MGHLGPVRARYEVLPVPAVTTRDAVPAGRRPTETRPVSQRPAAEPAPDKAPTAGD